MTKFNLDGMSHVEMIGIIEEIVKRIKTESFSEGYEAAMERVAEVTQETGGKIADEMKRFEAIPKLTPEIGDRLKQIERDRIVEQAKKDVEELKKESVTYRLLRTKFVINREKRTVVCLLERYDLGYIAKRGIAKCAPGDCFNVHIGKAIALRRALGLEVPAEYLNAPQPTEVRVGDEIYDEYYQMSGKVYAIDPEYRTYGEDAGYYFGKSKGWLTYIDPRNFERRIERKFVKVTDDSREVSE